MAVLKNIPDEHHVLRWARPREHLVRSNDGKIIAFDHSLFKCRNSPEFVKSNGGPEKNLSVNYVEYFSGTIDAATKMVVQDYNKAVTVKKVMFFRG